MAKARVRVKNIETVIMNAKKVLEDVRSSPDMLKQIGDFTVERIKAETRAGYSLPNKSKLPPLKDQTIALREEAEALGLVDAEFYRSSDFANNTLTGQVLGSLTYEIDERSGSLEVFVPDTPRFDGPETNKDVAENLSDLGREFIGYNDKMVKRIKRLVLDEYRRRIKK